MTTAPPRRRGLTTRLALFGIAVAIVTGVIGGVLAAGLIHHAVVSGARHQLAQLADATAQASADERGRQRLRLTLAALHVRTGWAGIRGEVGGEDPLVRAALDPRQLAEVRDGAALSLTAAVRDTEVLIEARPAAGGGAVVLVQRAVDAGTAGAAAARMMVIAVLIGTAVAALVGSLLARRLAAPLRRAAAAAADIAAGRRDVAVPQRGPREVAEISAAVTALSTALGRAEEQRREFLMAVSHELRTPLTAITGYAESLAEGVVPEAERAAAAATILRESQRLGSLVQDLLDLARSEADDFRVEVADVDAAALVREAHAAWQTRCATSNVEFRAVLPPAAVWVTTDAKRLRQIIDALLDNAVRVTPRGMPVVLELRADGATVLLQVRDGGPGLTDDDLRVAFDRSALFHRYRGQRPVGTGIGLSIVGRLVTLLGGNVTAGHAPEGGAEFTVRLPRQPDP